MVGMVITSARPARIVGVISSAYMSVAIQGPNKSGANKTREIGSIDLPAQKPVLLSAESVHLLLSGNRQTISTANKVSVIVTVQFDDQTIRAVTIMAQPVGSNVAAQASAVEAKPVTPPTPPAPSKTTESPVEVAKPAKPVVAPKPPVAEVRPIKTAPVVVAKPAPAPVAVTPPPVPVVLPAPVAVVVVPSEAPPVVEPKKAPETKPAEPPKPVEARASAECFSLADELRNCDRSNDRMLEWCETSAKSRYSCSLTMEQLRKLKK